MSFSGCIKNIQPVNENEVLEKVVFSCLKESCDKSGVFPKCYTHKKQRVAAGSWSIC